MTRLRVHNFCLSLDGFAAGPDQSLDAPMGVGSEHLHDWFRATPAFRRMVGEAEVPDDDGVDARFAAAGDVNVGANIMGRNMFGPIRGDWPDDEWRGWWGPNPPYHTPVFVLTHHDRAPIEMAGGTTFHFVTTGIEDALAQATQAAQGADVRLGGGVSAVRQYLAAGLIDELHLAYSPVLLGAGERLFDDVPGVPAGYEVAEFTPAAAALHVRLVKRSSAI